MIIPDMEKLYEPYSKNADLKTSLLYWTKEAKKLGIPDDMRDQAIAETFLEMANGKTFPIGTCDCGCDFPIEWSCVALNHYVLKKMISVKEDLARIQGELMQKRLTDTMIKIIEAENAAYTAAAMTPSKWTDWSKSEVINAVRGLRNKWTGSPS